MKAKEAEEDEEASEAADGEEDNKEKEPSDVSGQPSDSEEEPVETFPRSKILQEKTSFDDLADQSSSSIHIPSLNNASHADKEKDHESAYFYSRRGNFNLNKGSSKKQLAILILIGILVISATVFLLKKQFKQEGNEGQQKPLVPVETPTQMPTPTPEPLNRSKYKLRVLNGTTRTGLAASISGKLKDLGYQQEKTANATNSSFTQTFVRVKPGLTSLLDQLIKDLSPDFVAQSGEELKETDTADSEIILGTR